MFLFKETSLISLRFNYLIYDSGGLVVEELVDG